MPNCKNVYVSGSSRPFCASVFTGYLFILNGLTFGSELFLLTGDIFFALPHFPMAHADHFWNGIQNIFSNVLWWFTHLQADLSSPAYLRWNVKLHGIVKKALMFCAFKLQNISHPREGRGHYGIYRNKWVILVSPTIQAMGGRSGYKAHFSTAPKICSGTFLSRPLQQVTSESVASL